MGRRGWGVRRETDTEIERRQRDRDRDGERHAWYLTPNQVCRLYQRERELKLENFILQGFKFRLSHKR